jgi:hypothetical protein
MIVELASLALTEIEDVDDESNGTSWLEAIWSCGVNSKTFVQVNAGVVRYMRPLVGRLRESGASRHVLA